MIEPYFVFQEIDMTKVIWLYDMQKNSARIDPSAVLGYS